MSNEKKTQQHSIWTRTYLGRLFVSDRPFAVGVSAMLVLYLFVFLIRLEIFPCYLFAMYSDIKPEKSLYKSYNIIIDEQPFDLSTLDYRQYTYLMNTISQYDGTITNHGYHPEAKYLDKYISALGLAETTVHRRLQEPYLFTNKTQQIEMQRWICRLISTDSKKVVISKDWWSWTDGNATFSHSERLYPDD